MDQIQALPYLDNLQSKKKTIFLFTLIKVFNYLYVLDLLSFCIIKILFNNFILYYYLRNGYSPLSLEVRAAKVFIILNE